MILESGVPQGSSAPRAPIVRTADQGFERFYAENFIKTMGLVVALRGNRATAEDVVQDAFVRALERWDEVRGMDRPDLWIHRVALNRAVSLWRRLGAEARALTKIAGHGHEENEWLPEPTQFWESVRRLPPRQAQVVALRYAADLSLSDIAIVTGLAVGTVKAHLHRAKGSLARMLGDSSREE